MNESITLPKFLRKSSPVFKYFPDLDEVTYGGVTNGRVITFNTLEGGQKGRILMIAMIRRQEAEIWESYQGFLTDLLAIVEAKLHGIYHFELLSMHMRENMEKFQRQEFLKGMSDLANHLSIGKPQFVQYCSILGILSKYAFEDFGKITFKPHVQVLEQEPEKLDVPLERLIKAGETNEAFSGLNRLIFYDLSREPLYDSRNAAQSEVLDRLGRKFDANGASALTEVTVIDANGLHPLFVKSQIELELF